MTEWSVRLEPRTNSRVVVTRNGPDDAWRDLLYADDRCSDGQLGLVVERLQGLAV